MHFDSAYQLLRHVDAYLDRLVNNPPRSAKEARDRLRYLLFLRDEMERFHFPHPRFAVLDLIRILHESITEMDRETLAEVLPQLRLLKYTYDVRKWAYERTRAAYISNRAALRIYELDILGDFLPFFPYGGEYRMMLERVGGSAYIVLRKELELFGAREPRLEVEIGEHVKARNVPPKKGVLRDRLSTVILISAAIRRAWEEGKKEVERRIRKIRGIERVLEYERIVRRYDPTSFSKRPHRLWELLQELEERGFIVDGDIDPAVLEGLRKKRLVKYRFLKERTEEYLRDFFFRYYLFTAVRDRRNRPILPGLPPEPEEIPVLRESDIQLIKEKERVEKDLSIPSRYAGAALLCIRRGRRIERLVGTVRVEKERLQTYVGIVREYIEGGKRIRKFMEKLGGARGNKEDR